MKHLRCLFLLLFLPLVILPGCREDIIPTGGEGEIVQEVLKAIIKGLVRDQETGKPVEGVTVSTEPETVSVATGSDGRYEMEIELEEENPTSSRMGDPGKSGVIRGRVISGSNFKLIFTRQCYKLIITHKSENN